MLPDMHAQFHAMSISASRLLACQSTPKQLRKPLLKLIRKIKKILPPDARKEVKAAEARAVISAAVILAEAPSKRNKLKQD